MKLLPTFLSILFCLVSAPRPASAQVRGKILDPADAPISGARVTAFNRLGVVAEISADELGAFQFPAAENAVTRLVVSAAGFQTASIPVRDGAPPMVVRLTIAPRVDSVTVTGSTIDTLSSELGSSVSIVPREEIEQRNEASALELLRQLPGLAVVQTGSPGRLTSLYLRGGDSKFNLVQVDGVPVNAFGGDFDFAHIPAGHLERIEVSRGAQSAIYGSYANAGVVNFVTRSAVGSPALDLVAEGGSHRERRFALGGAGTFAGNGLSWHASRVDTDGPVSNGDYRNEGLSASLDRRFRKQSLALRANHNASEGGFPGSYGSDPAGLFGGLDLVSRGKNNFGSYLAHYQADLSERVRQELFGTFFQNNGHFESPFGSSFNKDLRAQLEARTIVSLGGRDTLAAGVAASREQVSNTFISEDGSRPSPLRRDQQGIYVENRWQPAPRWFLNIGVRVEIIRTFRIPPDATFDRPELRAHMIVQGNPKIAVAYVLRPDKHERFGMTRLHSSFGTGIRPPDGLDMAFTNNPALKPERTLSADVGVEQRLFRNRLSAEATYFYSRYYDLIVSLAGSLTRLSSFRSDNLANSRGQGLETEVRLQPNRWFSATASYTFLASKILSLDGAAGLAPRFFKVGQPLLRRPRHSSAVTSSVRRGRLSANFTGYFRGQVLDVEPNIGASAGLFPNPGYANLGLGLNYDAGGGITLYANARNLLNRLYEEALGYPALKFNFVSGVRWSFGRAR